MPEEIDHRTRVGAERRQRMKAQLADAALRVMAEQGPDGLSIDTIIQAADVSRGTFYKYHDAPAALVAEVGSELARDLIHAMAPALDQVEDPAMRLAIAFRSTLQLARENPLMAKFLVRAGWPVTDQVQVFSSRAAANLETGIKTGRFRNIEPAVATSLIGGLLIGVLAAQLASDGSAKLEEDATTALLRGLGLAESDARMLAVMPFETPALPSGGILARSLAAR